MDSLLSLLILAVVVIIIGVVSVAGAVLMVVMIVQSTQRKGKLGINVRREDCPKCGLKLPMVRRPTSARQAMWGGWTCQGCGAELDKWGQIIEP